MTSGLGTGTLRVALELVSLLVIRAATFGYAGIMSLKFLPGT